MKEEKIKGYLDIILREGNYTNDNNSVNDILYDRLMKDVHNDSYEFLETCKSIIILGNLEGYINGTTNEGNNSRFSYTNKGMEYKKSTITNYIKMVEEFHTTFKAPVLETPQIPSADRAALRVSLLQEEINELKEAIANNDLVEAFDAFLDIQYVLSGALLEFGLKDIFDEGFAEVQRSNMSKACNSEQEAIDTLEFYKDKDGTEGYYKQDGDLWLVYRSGDDKVLKNKYYSAASLAKFIEK